MNRIERIDKSITIHQLREPVPVQLQGQFHAEVRTLRTEIERGERPPVDEPKMIERLGHLLTEPSPRHTVERMMLYFRRLACCKSIEALRFAESLCDRLEGDLRYLALMAELELRMQVYEELTDTPQALIASGLGGLGELVRLNGVAMQARFEPWEAYQRELMHSELSRLCEAEGGRIEEELWGQEYYGFRLLLPYYAEVPELIESFMASCNEYGQFIHPDCRVTNLLLLSHEDIQQVVQLYRQRAEGKTTNIDVLLQDIMQGLNSPSDEAADSASEEDKID